MSQQSTLTLTPEDLAAYSTVVEFNEVEIFRSDILSIPKLMQYVKENNIYFNPDDINLSLNLKDFSIYDQNQIGLIFMEYYGYIIQESIDSPKFFNLEILRLFRSDDKILSFLNKALIKSPDDTKISIIYIIDVEMNLLILNFFSKNFRNFKSVNKTINESYDLYDIHLYGAFEKVTNITQFMLEQFNTYIRTTRGSIPFSSNFGSVIKEAIQNKYLGFTKDVITEDIVMFLNALSDEYNINFKLLSIKVSEVQKPGSSITVSSNSIDIHLRIEIILQADEEEAVQITLM